MGDRKAFVFDTNFIIENIKNIDEVVQNLSTDFNVYVTQVSIDERIAQNRRESKEKFDKVVYFKKKLKSVFVRDDIRTKGCRYVETVYNNE